MNVSIIVLAFYCCSRLLPDDWLSIGRPRPHHNESVPVIKIASLPWPIEFLLNLIAANFGTGLFEAELSNLFHPHSLGGIYLKQIVLSATVAFLLGSFVFYRWKYASSKWVWIVGICGFAFHAILPDFTHFTPEQRGYLLSVALDAVSVRMVSYSLGAACASLIVARVGSTKT